MAQKTVCVTMINPSQFYYYEVPLDNEFLDFESRLDSEMRCQAFKAEGCSTGILYAIYLENSCKWCRGKILNDLCTKTGIKHEVFLIDYGDIRVIHDKFVFNLPTCLWDFPPQAKFFQLYGIVPTIKELDINSSLFFRTMSSSEWDVKAVKAVEGLLEQTLKIILSIMETTDDVDLGQLYLILPDITVQLNDFLLKKNFALYSEKFTINVKNAAKVISTNTMKHKRLYEDHEISMKVRPYSTKLWEFSKRGDGDTQLMSTKSKHTDAANSNCLVSKVQANVSRAPCQSYEVLCNDDLKLLNFSGGRQSDFYTKPLKSFESNVSVSSGPAGISPEMKSANAPTMTKTELSVPAQSSSLNEILNRKKKNKSLKLRSESHDCSHISNYSPSANTPVGRGRAVLLKMINGKTNPSIPSVTSGFPNFEAFDSTKPVCMIESSTGRSFENDSNKRKSTYFNVLTGDNLKLESNRINCSSLYGQSMQADIKPTKLPYVDEPYSLTSNQPTVLETIAPHSNVEKSSDVKCPLKLGSESERAYQQVNYWGGITKHSDHEEQNSHLDCGSSLNSNSHVSFNDPKESCTGFSGKFQKNYCSEYLTSRFSIGAKPSIQPNVCDSSKLPLSNSVITGKSIDYSINSSMTYPLDFNEVGENVVLPEVNAKNRTKVKTLLYGYTNANPIEVEDDEDIIKFLSKRKTNALVELNDLKEKHKILPWIKHKDVYRFSRAPKIFGGICCSEFPEAFHTFEQGTLKELFVPSHPTLSQSPNTMCHRHSASEENQTETFLDYLKRLKSYSVQSQQTEIIINNSSIEATSSELGNQYHSTQVDCLSSFNIPKQDFTSNLSENILMLPHEHETEVSNDNTSPFLEANSSATCSDLIQSGEFKNWNKTISHISTFQETKDIEHSLQDLSDSDLPKLDLSMNNVNSDFEKQCDSPVIENTELKNLFNFVYGVTDNVNVQQRQCEKVDDFDSSNESLHDKSVISVKEKGCCLGFVDSLPRSTFVGNEETNELNSCVEEIQNISEINQICDRVVIPAPDGLTVQLPRHEMNVFENDPTIYNKLETIELQSNSEGKYLAPINTNDTKVPSTDCDVSISLVLNNIELNDNIGTEVDGLENCPDCQTNGSHLLSENSVNNGTMPVEFHALSEESDFSKVINGGTKIPFNSPGVDVGGETDVIDDCVSQETELSHTSSEEMVFASEEANVIDALTLNNYGHDLDLIPHFKLGDGFDLSEQNLSKSWMFVSKERGPSPISSLERSSISSYILQILRSLGYLYLFPIQSYSWPYLFRGNDICCISPKGTGKTWGYLVMMINQIMSKQIYSNVEKSGSGPFIVVLTSSWEKVDVIYNFCQQFNRTKDGEMVYFKVMKLYEKYHSGSKEALEVLSGCDMLVATASAIAHMLNLDGGYYISFRRMCQLIIDDGDVVVENHPHEVRDVLQAFKVEIARRKKKSCQHQLIVCGQYWSPVLKSIMSITSHPLILISSPLEAAIYMKIKFTVIMATSSDKNEKIVDILRKHLCAKMIIFFSKTKELKKFESFLSDRNIPFGSVHNEMLNVNIESIIQQYKYHENGFILLCSDGVSISINVSADIVIHYDIPQWSRGQFAERLKPILTYSCNLDSQHCYIILGQDCDSFIVGLSNFLHRLYDNKLCDSLPSELGDILNTFNLKNKEDSQLCPFLKASGGCRHRKFCLFRHYISPKLDQPRNIPSIGFVEVFIGSVLSANHYFGILLSHLNTDGEVTNFMEEQTELKEALKTYYETNELVPVTSIPDFESVYGIVDNSELIRVKILSRQTTLLMSECVVKLVYIDSGRVKNFVATCLVHLPDYLAVQPNYLINIYLSGIVPSDHESLFSPQCIDFVKLHLENKIASGKIMLSLGSSLWLNSLLKRVKLENLNCSINKFNLKQTMLLDKLAVAYDEHLPNLYDLCREGGINIPDYHQIYLDHEDKVTHKVSMESGIPSYSYLQIDEEYHEIAVFNVVNPHRFYVVEYSKHKLLKEIENMVSDWVECFRKEFPKYLIEPRKGDYCVARENKEDKWFRAQVVAVNNTNNPYSYEVFFVDYGDNETVQYADVLPISEKVLQKFPFLAIECELAHIDLNDAVDSWPVDVTDYFNSLCREESDYLKILFVKILNKKHSSVIPLMLHYTVELLDTTSEETISLHNLLINEFPVVEYIETIPSIFYHKPQYTEITTVNEIPPMGTQEYLAFLEEFDGASDEEDLLELAGPCSAHGQKIVPDEISTSYGSSPSKEINLIPNANEYIKTTYVPFVPSNVERDADLPGMIVYEYCIENLSPLPVTWGQRNCFIVLRIMVPKLHLQDISLYLYPGKLNLSVVMETGVFGISQKFYLPIDPELSHCDLKEAYCELKLMKAFKNINWPRLWQTNLKFSWCRPNLELLEYEIDQIDSNIEAQRLQSLENLAYRNKAIKLPTIHSREKMEFVAEISATGEPITIEPLLDSSNSDTDEVESEPDEYVHNNDDFC